MHGNLLCAEKTSFGKQHMYIQDSIQHYLDELASAQPAPGGGSASALSGAMAAALASMVCRLTLGKQGYEEAQREIEEILAQTERLRARFGDLMGEDSAAYGRLSASYKLPRDTDEERAARASAIQHHLLGAAEVPLEAVECAARLLGYCRRIAALGNTNVLSDLLTASLMANAAAQGGTLMVRVNLRYLKDEGVKRGFQERLDLALRQVEEDGQYVKNVVEGRA
jgi:formiminotetrahydrofolate cyclodeaminase